MKCRVMWHLIRVYTVCYYTLLGLVTRRIDIGACERQKGRSACTFAKSDQPLYFSCATTLLEMRSNIMQHLIWVCTVNYLLMSRGQFHQRVYDVFFVLKTSYEVRTLKIGFHQTIELCELLTFCRIFKTNI